MTPTTNDPALALAWVRAHPDAVQTTPAGDGNGTNTIPKYVLQCHASFPGMVAAPYGDCYAVMMWLANPATPALAKAFAENYAAFEGGDPRPLWAAQAAAGFGLLINIWSGAATSWGAGIALACRQTNVSGLPCPFSTRFGSEDFRGAAPGEVPADGLIEAPADAPVPPNWPAETEADLGNGPNQYGNWVGHCVGNNYYGVLNGDPTKPMTVVPDPRGSFLRLALPGPFGLVNNDYLKVA